MFVWVICKWWRMWGCLRQWHALCTFRLVCIVAVFHWRILLLCYLLHEEVDCVDPTSEEPLLHIRFEVVNENGVVVEDVIWALWELRLVVSALTCAGVGICPCCDACYLDAIRENGCVT